MMDKQSDPNQGIAELHEHLAWFLGPKAEHRGVFENAILTILRDYVHWRANYFPGDPILIKQGIKRELQPGTDRLADCVHEMIAQLRRNFPFYSPRYLGHMLSDISMPSMLGYFAGMLYNPNNVTTEAAPVTVEWELEACNALMRMFGYTPPAQLRPDETETEYRRRLDNAGIFGWSHTTFDGTSANIEALWIARGVKYAPLAIRDAAQTLDVPLFVQLPGSPTSESNGINEAKSFADDEASFIKLQDAPLDQLTSLRPDETLRLMDAYLDAATAKAGSRARAWQLFHDSPQNILIKGCAEEFCKKPPLIFATGAAHYSIKKAADLLGLGTINMVSVVTDKMFRMDPQDLKNKIAAAIEDGKSPLAVVGVCGTTEEGAVDPIHRILQVREEIEAEYGVSFWVHGDAAWGGYIRTLFAPTDQEIADVEFEVFANRYDFEYPSESRLALWSRQFLNWARANFPDQRGLRKRIRQIARDYGACRYSEALEKFRQLRLELQIGLDDTTVKQMTQGRILQRIRCQVKDRVRIRKPNGAFLPIHYCWDNKSVHKSFLALPNADSITCDPHKMGYAAYPCGVVAFKDDRVRKVTRHETPYITSIANGEMDRYPPRYPKWSEKKQRNVPYVEAFAPFILEGSRPGAVASSLWLATKVLPPNFDGHGRIIRSTLLAARELYERLNALSTLKKAEDFEVVMLTGEPPDTNVVTFVLKPKLKPTLEGLNILTESVYADFQIDAERGDRKFSYNQDFFMSHTTMHAPSYPYSTVKDLISERCDLTGDVGGDYEQHGLFVLRATVMNPYLLATRDLSTQNVLEDFVARFIASARVHVATGI
ncbi:MAG: hypothetical protein HQ519_15635 [Planctomycetes bacterium]|nr:hypothetical protein [Planctomycetota bacterium]